MLAPVLIMRWTKSIIAKNRSVGHLPVTGLVCPSRMKETRGGEAVTSQMDTVPSSEPQHSLERSLFANFTTLTCSVCWRHYSWFYLVRRKEEVPRRHATPVTVRNACSRWLGKRIPGIWGIALPSSGTV